MGRQLGEGTTYHDCHGHKGKALTVDWSSGGTKLASGGHDRLVKIWAVEGNGQGRELLSIAGFNGTVERVRWHPHEDVLCTASADRSIRLYDVRVGSSSSSSGGHSSPASFTSPHQQAGGGHHGGAGGGNSSSTAASLTPVAKWSILAKSKYCHSPASVEWHPNGRSVVVAEKDSMVHVYDLRKLESTVLHKSSSSSQPPGSSSSTSSRGGGGGTGVYGSSSSRHYRTTTTAVTVPVGKPVESHDLYPDVVDDCHFSPRGRHIVAATTKQGDGTGKVRIIPCDGGTAGGGADSGITGTTGNGGATGEGISGGGTKVGEKNRNGKRPMNEYVAVGHTGPIYCLRFSPCGMHMATGGGDALVGLWDTDEVVCTRTITRLHKLVRSVSFSHDSRLVASCSEEPFIDIADVSTGEKVGEVRAPNGADEMAWNPRGYALAYASGDNPNPQQGGMMMGGGGGGRDHRDGGMLGRGGIGGGYGQQQQQTQVAHVTVVKLAFSRS